MTLPAVLATLAALVGAATVLGLLWRRAQGRVRHERGTTVIKPTDVPGLRRLASGATLLQFSTEVCAPCRSTRVVLGEIASELSGVAHVDLDVTHRPDLASRFHILQTPTTLILDRQGVVRARIGGAARRDSVRAELDRVLAA
ncbi:thioredoxin family protein [Schumannella luteola]